MFRLFRLFLKLPAWAKAVVVGALLVGIAWVYFQSLEQPTTPENDRLSEYTAPLDYAACRAGNLAMCTPTLRQRREFQKVSL